MEGVILFADDHVFDNPFEKGLFESLSREQQHPVLPIINLDLLETSIKSTSSIKALIVDWNFIKDASVLGEEVIGIKNYETPYALLKEIQLFALVYIYSETGGIENTYEGKDLIEKFGEKIKFRVKDKSEEKIPAEKKQIMEDIDYMYKQSGNIQLPIKWTQVINQSVQGIFSELNDIDKKWISDLYKTAEDDGVDPSVEVVNLFQNLLAERVILSKDLRDSIKDSVIKDRITEPLKYARLFRTFLYSVLDKNNDPIMTGDIFDLSNGKFGILITPECDIRKVQKNIENDFEFLVFDNSNKIDESFFIRQFRDSKDKISKLIKSLDSAEKEKILSSIDELKTDYLKGAFTQPHPRVYILPCFEFEKGNFKTKASIDFSSGLEFRKVKDSKKENRVCKLNTPYIQDLRQRFLAYKGRVGVPSFPDNLRSWLLSN